MTIQAPYRFVPLSSLVVLPDWAEKVSHDKPFKDGICGELDVEISTHGEVCVGGQQEPATSTQVGKVHFYRTPDQRLAIPASSLKGMLRNVVEIATFSRFKQVEDKKLGVRDIRQAGNFYHTRIKDPKAGWLKFEDGEWKIYPCNFARIHQKDLISALHIGYNQWARNNRKTIEQRYELIGLCPAINFRENGTNSVGQALAIPSNTRDALQGKIVVTGQPGEFYLYEHRDERKQEKVRKASKKYEFVFYDDSDADILAVPTKVMEGFRQIYENTEEWEFWQKNLTANQGIPVFFHCDAHNKDKVISLGLSMMYKLPYEHSIHDAIEHTSDTHTGYEQQYDFSDLLFGTVDEQEKISLKGRVNIGLGILQSQNVNPVFTQATVLSSPKLTYYPTYIRQKNGSAAFSQLMNDGVCVSGWKRYPIKAKNILPPPEGAGPSVQVRLEVVPKNVKFQSKIRFHNLLPIELGALLWCIDFGQRSYLRHGLGIGKPYGLGQISLNIKADKLRANYGQSRIDLVQCRQAFLEYMKAETKNNFEELSPIQALLEYAQPNSLNYLDYQPLADFVTYKGSQYVNDFSERFHHYAPIQAGKKSNPANQEAVLKKIQAYLAKKPKNNAESEEMFILVELEKASSENFSNDDKFEVAMYLKTKFTEQGKWRENSSSNKAERKQFEQTNRIKRFL